MITETKIRKVYKVITKATSDNERNEELFDKQESALNEARLLDTKGYEVKIIEEIKITKIIECK